MKSKKTSYNTRFYNLSLLQQTHVRRMKFQRIKFSMIPFSEDVQWHLWVIFLHVVVYSKIEVFTKLSKTVKLIQLEVNQNEMVLFNIVEVVKNPQVFQDSTNSPIFAYLYE